MKATEENNCNTSETDEKIWFTFTRRHFMSLAGWGLFFTAMGAFLIKILGYKGFFYPRVLFEPSPRFTVGEPGSFPENSVTKLKTRRVFIVRNGDSFMALSVICTHLGCAVEFSKGKDIFECPCHGSKYYRNGINFAGPAPKPLDHYEMAQDHNGKLVVDKSKLVSAQTELVV